MTRRILVSYVSLVVLVLLLLEVPLGFFLAERERDRLADGVRSDAVVLAAFYEDVLDNDAPLDPAVAADYTERTGARVAVVDADGISLVDTEADPARDLSTRPEIAEALAGVVSTGTRHSSTLGTDILYVAVPVASGGDVHGAVRVTLPTHEVDERVQGYWLALLGVGMVVLAAVGLIGWAVARSLTRPIRQMQETAAVFSAGVLDPRPAPVGAPGELVALSAALNVMAERLADLLHRQRAFVADASHQLRTPLTALQLNLEELEVDAPPEQQKGVAAALREVGRLTALVEQLLGLARADQPVAPVAVDAADLARNRVDTWGALAESEGVTLTYEGSAEPVVVQAAPGAIDQVLDNLVDNALTASPPGSPVVVSVRLHDGVAEIDVVDHGPGLSADDKVHALERFWRKGPPGSGTGLGLAIVDSLVRGAGGTVDMVDTPGGGLTVRCRLPVRGRVP